MKGKQTKPSKQFYAPSELSMRRMQDALHRYDDRVSALERKWGVDRLVWLVGADLRDRFEKQLGLLNEAIEKQQDVEHQVDVTLRGVDAVEQAAIASGVQPLSGQHVEGRLPDGRVLAIVPNSYDAAAVPREGRQVAVYSVDEVGLLIAEHAAAKMVDKVKDVFPGATVESVSPMAKELNDEIPF